MAGECYKWLQRIKDVEREFAATRIAVERLRADAQREPGILEGELAFRDLSRAAQRLEGTYIIRLFAEFEAGLRQCCPQIRGSDPPSRMRDLLDGMASTRRIPYDQLLNAHAL